MSIHPLTLGTGRRLSAQLLSYFDRIDHSLLLAKLPEEAIVEPIGGEYRYGILGTQKTDCMFATFPTIKRFAA